MAKKAPWFLEKDEKKHFYQSEQDAQDAMHRGATIAFYRGAKNTHDGATYRKTINVLYKPTPSANEESYQIGYRTLRNWFGAKVKAAFELKNEKMAVVTMQSEVTTTQKNLTQHVQALSAQRDAAAALEGTDKKLLFPAPQATPLVKSYANTGFFGENAPPGNRASQSLNGTANPTGAPRNNENTPNADGPPTKPPRPVR